MVKALAELTNFDSLHWNTSLILDYQSILGLQESDGEESDRL